MTPQHHQQVMSDAEWQLRQSQQQPGMNPNYPNQKPGLFTQPVEDPLNTGRDLEREH